MTVVQPAWIVTLRSMRFMQLLFFSWAALLAQAVLMQSLVVSLAINLLYMNVMLVTLSSNGSHPHIRYVLVALWCLALASRLFVPAGLDVEFFVFSKSIGSLLLAICITSMMRYVLLSRQVTSDLLFAAVVVYILIAILFAQLYSITSMLLPDSFTYPATAHLVAGRLPDLSFNYFSFVTIATLGYGDIAPRHPVAQILASVEAVVGQFYVAIVVAWLVSVYAAQGRAGDRQ